jgi:hypothetical protein
MGYSVRACLHVSAAAKENKVTFSSTYHIQQYKEYAYLTAQNYLSKHSYVNAIIKQ